MASYFEVKNDNFNVVIDDTYENLSFVHFSDVVTIQASDERGVDSVGWQNISDGAYGKYQAYSRYYTFEEVGIINKKVPSYVGIRQVNAANPNEQSYAMVAAYPGYATFNDPSTPVVGFYYRINSMELGAQYQMVSYTELENRTPSKEGLQIYNENRKLIFDAALGFLQVMDSQYHKRDVFSSAVQSFPVYNSTLPELDYNRMYLIPRQRPYAMTGGTIITNFRQYVPRMRRDPVTRQLYVDLAMWGKTGGSRLQQYQYVFSFMVAYVQF
ncbi:TPA: hypothetical protein ACVB8O_002139 [Acinetobacter baumannii]